MHKTPDPEAPPRISRRDHASNADASWPDGSPIDPYPLASQALATFGEHAQLLALAEELAEAAASTARLLNGKGDRLDVLAEVVDVESVTASLRDALGAPETWERTRAEKRAKLARKLETGSLRTRAVEEHERNPANDPAGTTGEPSNASTPSATYGDPIMRSHRQEGAPGPHGRARIHTGFGGRSDAWACRRADCDACADAYTAACRRAYGGTCEGSCACGAPCEHMEHDDTTPHACAAQREFITISRGERQW